VQNTQDLGQQDWVQHKPPKPPPVRLPAMLGRY
jgi:hypothetical protein